MANLEKLFEVSWEVCNFVGGINTVIKTKAQLAVEHFKEEYILIGPWLEFNNEFVEAPHIFSSNVKNILDKKNFKCKLGYWDIESKPKVILVAYHNRYDSNQLLYQLWQDFGVESFAAHFDYIEPVIFATAAAQIIEALTEESETETIYAHFHEWLSGAGLLYLKKNKPNICTLFTTHATIMGRALASLGKSVFELPENYDYLFEAKKHSVLAKQSMELASAREADSFTTVSNITADECKIILQKYPDKITFNGLNLENNHSIEINPENIAKARAKLFEVAKTMLNINLPEGSQLWMTSGRNEMHNKGYDALLMSLAELETHLNENSPPIIVFFFIVVKRCTKTDSLLEYSKEQLQYEGQTNILTHHIDHPYSDPILQLAKQLKFDTLTRKIHVIYSPAYLDGSDGVFDIPYYNLLSACDLSIFPSFYEPWGYTPLESIACGVPTITTNLAGFGSWIGSLSIDYSGVVHIVDRRGIYFNDFIHKLTQTLSTQVVLKDADRLKTQAKALAKFANWKFFFRNYLDAYEQANDMMLLRTNEGYIAKFGEGTSSDISKITNRTSRMRALRADYVLPDEFKELVTYSYNLWWSWQLKGYKLFSELDPVLWQELKSNPIALLNKIPHSILKQKITTPEYVNKLNLSVELLKQYLLPHSENRFYTDNINDEHPIAYFCMEYGLHESLPFYAGGLGILAGDHLKTASDMQISLLGVGLFYKYGYFHQSINPEGQQIARPDFVDLYNQPLILLKNENGKEVLIELELPGRMCYLRVWTLNIGKTKLYLLDSDCFLNTEEDRKITQQLYPPDVEIRLIQRIALGIGGVRLIQDILHIQPSVFHMNECHTAFLVLERMTHLVKAGYTLSESVEIIRKTTLYTIHTSQPAAQEIYSDEMVKKYFYEYISKIGLSMPDMLAQGRTNRQEHNNFFSLTVSSIRSCLNINGVSKLHGELSKILWQDIWQDALELEVPIKSITNGVHVQTWLGENMQELYNHYLPSQWFTHLSDKETWQAINKIPDKELWSTHLIQKQKLLTTVKKRIPLEYLLRGDQKLIDKTLKHLHSNAFVIGFSRRFVEYKRPTLIFRNPQRLAKILTNPKRPVVLLLSGKSHPFDNKGKEIIHEMIQQTRNEIYDGRIIFLENYDIALGKLLVSGCDIWLNNPTYGTEACGTSGMKAALNGVMNYSVRDGWWYEAFTPEIGWEIDTFDVNNDQFKNDDIENYFLLSKLKNEIIRLFYDVSDEGYPIKWVKKMKTSIMAVGQQFNSQRMLSEYYDLYYSPISKLGKLLQEENGKIVKDYVKWKTQILHAFKSIKIKKNHIREIYRTDNRGPLLDISITLTCEDIASENLRVELLLMKSGGNEIEPKSQIIPLNMIDDQKEGMFNFNLQYEIEEKGLYAYTIRITPHHALLRHPSELGLVLWV